MNKRQRKKQAKKEWGYSYRTAKAIERQFHEFCVWKKRYDKKYKRCKVCANILNCEELLDMNIAEVLNCEKFEAEPRNKRLDLMRECAEGVE